MRVRTAFLWLWIAACLLGVSAPARADVAVPVDVGIGPALLLPNDPLFSDQWGFSAISLTTAAIIDRDLIRKHSKRVPKQWRSLVGNLDQVRYRPWFLALVPELLIVSPQVWNTGMYGAVWRPIGAGIGLAQKPVRLSIDGAVNVMYVLVHSQSMGSGTPSAQSFTHIVRPGINLSLTLEVPITKSLLFDVGWSSDFFVPQPLGRPPWELTPFESSLWHLGGPFARLHVRFPVDVKM